MQGCNEVVVGVASEAEGTGAVGIGLEGLDAVVNGWVGVEMLVAVLALLVELFGDPLSCGALKLSRIQFPASFPIGLTLSCIL